MISRVLLFGTSYCEGQPARHLFTQWLDLVTKLNLDADILVVDSASPDLPDTGRARVLQLGDNIGHLTKTGRDGWGRAFCAGLQAAVDGGYRWAVHIETDLLFSRPVAPTLDKMSRSGVRVAAAVAHPWQWLESALVFADIGYVENTNLIERYDWENVTPTDFPEVRLERLTKREVFALPFRGYRNDLGAVTVQNMRKFFPTGIDWITHADAAVCREFLRVNGL
jgi:hypothetical protein